MHGGGLGFLRGGGDLHGGLVDCPYQIAHLVDGEVDRVGDGAGEILGHGGGYRQVTVGQVGDFIEQTQNGGLVALVLLGGFLQAAAGVLHHHRTDEDHRGQRQRAEHVGGQGIQVTAVGQLLETDGQVGGLVQQGLRGAEDVAGRFAHLEQFGRGFQDLVHRAGNEFEQLGDLRQTLARLGLGYPGNLHGAVAFQHGVEHAAEQAGVAAEHVGGLHRVLVTGQYLVDRTENPFRQQRLALGHGHLGGGRAALQQDVHHFLVLDLQLRNGFRQGGGHLVQGQHGLFAGKDHVGIAAQAVPVFFHRIHLRGDIEGHHRQAGIQIAHGQVTPAAIEVVTGVLEQGEGLGLARRRFGGVLGDTLRQHAQLTRVGDVLGVVARLHVQVGEVGKQQHDGDDQTDEQADDQRAAAHAGKHISCVAFIHEWPPPGPTAIPM